MKKNLKNCCAANTGLEENYLTQLEDACLKADIKTVKNLIRQGINPKGGYFKELTEKCYTISGPGNREILVTEENFVHMPFDNAIKSGNLELVKYLRDGGYYSEGNLDHATGTAVYYGHIQLVKYFVSTGADYHYNNEDALQLACLTGRMDIINYLIEQGADLQASANFLLNAITENHFEVAHSLMDIGLDLVWPIRKSYFMNMPKCLYYLTRQLIKRYPARVKEIEEYLTDFQKKKYNHLLGAGDFNLI